MVKIEYNQKFPNTNTERIDRALEFIKISIIDAFRDSKQEPPVTVAVKVIIES